MVKIQNNVTLAPFTSLRCGGPAEYFTICMSTEEAAEAISHCQTKDLHIFGYGTNSLISDKGLPGTTLLIHGGDITLDGATLTADAGVWWDDVVETAIQSGLWGIELMSGIPSSVGAAITGNIAAYGQQISDSLKSIVAYDRQAKRTTLMQSSEIDFAYRSSSLQTKSNLIVLQATFELSPLKTTDLKYASALSVADELELDPEMLIDRQDIILETRRQAGSLYDPADPDSSFTAGSFFKNPTVSVQQAKKLATFDETGKTMERILEQNKIHGGSTMRASAAHALLAAGFSRGQTWSNVRLHPEHVLKLENTGGASAQQIYDVAKDIMQTVEAKLGIELEPEVKYIGDFND